MRIVPASARGRWFPLARTGPSRYWCRPRSRSPMAHPTADRNFRLPGDPRPVRYEAFLSLDLVRGTFDGRIRIELELERAAEELVLHAVGLDISSAQVVVAGEPRAASVAAAAQSETVVLRTPSPIPAGRADLLVHWSGRFNVGLRGLYRAGPLAATQFEASDARRVFPCLDEPGFKAPWALTLEVPRGAVALANGRERSREERGNRSVVFFEETPPLPSYLVALVVGPLAGSPEAAAGAVPVRTLVRPREVGPHRFRPGGGAGGAPASRELLRDPLRLREARPGRGSRLRVRRDGERRPRRLPGGRPASRSGERGALGEEARRRGDHARARPPVVRQLGDHAMVG